MRHSVAWADSARPAASLLTLLAMSLAPAAHAADRALLNMLGYSADGDTFAFEEFGIQDGSGFAYSTVYVIDLANDKWTSGTPFEVQADDEAQTLAEVRAAAITKAQDTLDEYEIGVPVQIIGLIGDGEADATGRRLTWSTPACCGAGATQDDAFSLILSVRGITSEEDYCRDMSPVGYVLTYQDESGVRQLHADGDVLPKSRRCTLDYRIYAVVQPFESYFADGFERRRVAVIASYPFGFEGVDRRFLAVPIDK
jgi:predicted secreted protein